MKTFYENLSLICPKLPICQEKSCIKYHPRCFSGICVNYLNQNCQQKNCQLLHLSLEECKKKLKESDINGVYLINLCPQAENCKSLNTCQYLHREWFNSQQSCLQYLFQKCKSNTCLKKHLSWEDLQEEVQEKYLQDGFSPMNLCEKSECSCKRHLANLKGFCIGNFKGLCQSKGKCPKIHCDWEKSQDVKPSQFVRDKAHPCCKQLVNSNLVVDQLLQQKFQTLFKKDLIQKISASIKGQNVVDLLLIMDCTGSMASWIQAVKENILIIIDKFKNIIQNTMVRIAFIGYRDHCDGDKHIVWHEFTADVKKIKNFVSTQQATGGGDAAEDVAGALQKALTLDYSKHPESILCTFLFCDAPTHGKQYHDLTSDDQKDKIPQGFLENIMGQIFLLKKNNYFSCCKITQHTDKMFSIMQKHFKELEIAEFTCEKISDYVAFTLVSSYQKSQLKLVQQPKQKNTIRISATYKRHKPIQPKFWDKTSSTNEINHEKNFLYQLGTNQISGETVLEIEINPVILKNKNEIGKCSEIFRVFDIRNNRYLIAKLPKKLVLNMAKQQAKNPFGIQPISQFEEEEASRAADDRYYSALIAQQFAIGFREKLRKMDSAPPIFYVSPILYTLKQQFYGIKKLYAETEINLPNSEWKKISNNGGSLQKGYEAYGTFSHMSYDKSNKKIMITDLQGKDGIFSDPAIHINSEEMNGNDSADFITLADHQSDSSDDDKQGETNYKNIEKTDRQIYSYLNSKTDEGIKGIINFFEHQHLKCNDLCQELKLNRQIHNDDLPNTAATTDDKKLKLLKHQAKNVNCICDICGNQYEMSYQQYKAQEKNDFYCNQCSSSTEREDFCECCGNKFTHHYERTIRLGQIPTLCVKCDECKAQMLKCHYCQSNCMYKDLKGVIMSGQLQHLCKVGQDYFQQLQCQICSIAFDFVEWPTLEVYSSGQYKCRSCRQNDKLK